MALINLRNALMAGKRLPYDAEVEYLECAGTSSVFPYIDTGIVGSMDVTVSVRIWKSTKATNECAMGSWDRGNTRCWPLYFNSNKYYLGMGQLSHAFTEVTSEVWHDIALTKSGNTFTYTADGAVVGQSSSTLTFASTRTLYIGAMNDTGNPFYYFCGRFAFVKIYVAGTLVRDYIPVRKGNAGYLYDRVSGALFGNAGTGDFVLGQDVVPVEYIESHGTEWIDTGVPATGATNSEFQFKMSVAGFAFGARTAWNTYAYSLNYGTGNYAFNYGNNGVVATLTTNIPIDTNWHTAKIQSGGVLSLDEWTNTAGTYSFTTNGSLILFGTRQGSSLNQTASGFKYCKIWESSTPVRSFIPVRVGTDATSWEGAMMDVLTRRIYRNAGTGAFTYGNDLKYPIPAS